MKNRRLLWWTLVVIWCLGIYLVTDSPQFTGENTQEVVTQTITHIPTASEQSVDSSILNLQIRKFTHLSVFGFLAFLFWKALKPSRSSYILAWAFATVYAVTDEYHQSFETGRVASIIDIGIDSLGAIATLVIVFLYNRYIKNRLVIGN
nr:VanZ family protein [Fredinandcohnia onubensis]